MFGQCFLCRLHISVNPFPLWSALPPGKRRQASFGAPTLSFSCEHVRCFSGLGRRVLCRQPDKSTRQVQAQVGLLRHGLLLALFVLLRPFLGQRLECPLDRIFNLLIRRRRSTVRLTPSRIECCRNHNFFGRGFHHLERHISSTPSDLCDLLLNPVRARHTRTEI